MNTFKLPFGSLISKRGLPLTKVISCKAVQLYILAIINVKEHTYNLKHL